MFRTTPLVRSLALAFSSAALGALLTPSAALAQAQQPQGSQRLEKIEITGSNIKRTDAESPAPVQIITREEIERSGASTVSDLLRTLTVANTGSLTGAEIGNFTPGAATISLRGLGGQATLILVNGRRIAGYGITGFSSILTNIDSFPLEAIDRIEILKDGASAIYGSDAMAGVVNIILRRDYTGAKARLTYAQNKRGDLPLASVSLSGGLGDITGDRYNILGVYEHFDRDAMYMKDQRGVKSRLLNPENISLPGGRADWRSAYSFPGNIFYPVRARMPNCPSEQIGLGGLCRYDYYKDTTAYPELKRDSVFARGQFELNPTTTLFAEAGFAKSTYKYQFDAQFFYNDYGSGMLVIPGSLIGRDEDVVGLLYAANDVGPRKAKADVNEGRVLAGVKGSVVGWDYDAAVGYAESKVDVKWRNLLLEAQMNAALDAGLYVPGVHNPASVIAAISPENAFYRSGKADTTFLDVRATREIAQLPAGPLAVAVGAEYRSEKASDAYSSAFANNEVFGFGALASETFTRHVTGMFAEASVPVLRTLETSFAVRHDNYSIGGSATVPKFGFKWTAAEPIVLRGTYAEGYRAPNLRELSPSTSIGFANGVTDPVRCVNGDEPDCALSIQANISGNTHLKPEKSKGYTLGVILEPVKDVNLSFDYWDIKRDNEISQLDLTYLLLHQSIYSNYITRLPNGQISEVSLPYINIGQTEVKGFDVDARVTANAGELGKFSLRGVGSYTIDYLVTPVPGVERENFNGTYDQPRWRSTINVSWEKGPWTNELAVNHIGGFKYIGTPSQTCNVRQIYGANSTYCEVFPWTTLDYYVRYRGFKDVELAMSVHNITDKEPPFDARSFFARQSAPYNQTYHNALGRYITLTASYKFK